MYDFPIPKISEDNAHDFAGKAQPGAFYLGRVDQM